MLTIPDLISLVRPVCTLPFLLLCAQLELRHTTGLCVSTLGVYTIITGSDALDGWLARRLAQERPAGRTVDHVCDILFILTTLGFFAVRGLVPWWLPAAIAWAFGLYVVDSWWRTARQPQRTLLGSRLGHIGGILNYATVGLATVDLCLESQGLRASLLGVWYGGVSLLALGSGTERCWFFLQAITSHAATSRPAGNTPRSGC
jgi:phosphatidylglycerophosphate synthase